LIDHPGVNLVYAGNGEYLFSLSDPGVISASVVLRNFPDCFPSTRGEKDLFSDMCAGEFHDCPDPKVHIGRLLGRTSAGHDILINAEFDLTSWPQSFKKYDYGFGCRDHQRLATKGLDALYEELPVLG